MSSSNDTYFNLLASFAYLGRNKTFTNEFFSAHRSKVANVMVDSGAFTALNAKENRNWLTIDTYCDFLKENEKFCEKYVMLDVIGNKEKTQENYTIMIDRGLRPMFVLTMYDNNWEFLNYAISKNSNICVAGGTMTKGPWLIKRFQDACKKTNYKARIHGLGYVAFPNIVRAPIVSGDSASWILGSLKFGQVKVFTEKGLIVETYKSYHQGKNIDNELRKMLNKVEVTPIEFVNKDYFKGGLSLLNLLSEIAYIKFQKYVYSYKKRRLFLATGSQRQLRELLWVKENFNNVTYEKYRKEFSSSTKYYC